MADRLVNVTLTANTAPYVAGMNTATAATQRTAATAATANAGIKKTGATMATTAGQAGLLRSGLVTPIAAAGVAVAGAAKASIDWESAWAGVTKTVDGSDKQLSALEGDLRSMAKELPATHEEIAGVAEAAGQLGVETDNVADFTRTMVDLGETTNLTAEQSATAIARIANVMGTAEGDIERLGSSLVDLGNNSATTEAEILEMAQRIAGAGSTIGMTEQEVLGFAAALSSVGIRAEAGGTAISRVMVDMSSAVEAGGEDLQGFAEVAGMSADQFATAFREDPAAAIQAFVSGLGRINESGGNVFATLDQLGLGEIRVRDALLRMAESGDILSDSIETSNSAWEENLALSEEAERRYETTAASIARSLSQMRDAAIDAGNVIAPVFEELVSDAATLVGWLQTGRDELEEFAGDIAGALAGQEGRSAQERASDEFILGIPTPLDASRMWGFLGDEAEEAEEKTDSFLTKVREGAESALPGFINALEPSAGALDEVETEARQTSEQIDKLGESLFGAGRDAIALEESEYALSEAIDRAREASQDDELSKADQRDRLRDVATATQSLVLDMFDQGAATDDIIGKTENARAEFVDIATEILNDAEAAEELADKYGLVPGEVMTVVTLRDLATEDIGNIRDRLDAIDGKQARVEIINEVITNERHNTFFQTFGNQGRGGQDRHSGGAIMHDGGSVADATRMHSGGLRPDERVIIAQSGEFMMQRSAVDKAGLPFMHAVNDGNLDRAMAPVARQMMGGGSGAAGFGDQGGGHLTGELYLSSGEFLGVVQGQVKAGISEHDRGLKARTRAGTGRAR